MGRISISVDLNNVKLERYIFWPELHQSSMIWRVTGLALTVTLMVFLHDPYDCVVSAFLRKNISVKLQALVSVCASATDPLKYGCLKICQDEPIL